MTLDKPVEVDDLIVLLLGAPSSSGPPGKIEGITRLEKLVFLLEHELQPQWLGESASFVSHNFGPFSAKIYENIEILEAAGLVLDSSSISTTPDETWESENIIGDNPVDPYSTRNLSLTEDGSAYYSALLEDLPPGTEADLTEFKSRYANRPLRHLIRYVYERYPAFTDKSLIKDDVLK